MKISIVYESTTGNTEEMANAIASAAKEADNEVIQIKADSASKDTVLNSDLILLGSPAMGAEVLEDSVEDFFSSIEDSISGKTIGLFGSYDWGDGQWMRDWEERVKTSGATLLNDKGVIANLSPNEQALEACVNLVKNKN